MVKALLLSLGINLSGLSFIVCYRRMRQFLKKELHADI